MSGREGRRINWFSDKRNRRRYTTRKCQFLMTELDKSLMEARRYGKWCAAGSTDNKFVAKGHVSPNHLQGRAVDLEGGNGLKDTIDSSKTGLRGVSSFLGEGGIFQ